MSGTVRSRTLGLSCAVMMYFSLLQDDSGGRGQQNSTGTGQSIEPRKAVNEDMCHIILSSPCPSPDAVKKPWERSNSSEKSSLVSRSEDFNELQHKCCAFVDTLREIIMSLVSFSCQSETHRQHQ